MNYSRILVTTAALAALAACQPKTATTAAVADTSPAIATVNGSPITRDLYEFYIKGITRQDLRGTDPAAAHRGPGQPDPRQG